MHQEGLRSPPATNSLTALCLPLTLQLAVIELGHLRSVSSRHELQSPNIYILLSSLLILFISEELCYGCSFASKPFC